MATGRSFSSFFPMTQTQIDLQCTQRVLKKQQQKREKEEQLCNQLEVICQRQHDAHKRNRDLLKDFQKIEEDLALLAARTDNFRRNQENYKKQLQTLQSMHCTCAEPTSYTSSHVDHTCNTHINNLPGKTDGNICKHCHHTASLGYVGSSPINSSLCSNQHNELRGFCIHSTCCCIMCPHCNVHSQKKSNPTKDRLFHKNCMLTSNARDARVQQYPEVINDNDGSIKGRIIPSHANEDSIQCIWNSNKYGECTEILYMRPQKKMNGDEVVQNTVGRSTEQRSKEIPGLHEAGSSSLESHHKSSVSSSTSQFLPQLSPSTRHDNNENDHKTANKTSQITVLEQIYDKSPEGETYEQNMLVHPFFEGQSYNSENNSERLGMLFSLKAKSVQGLIDDGNQINKSYKTNEKGDMFEVSLNSDQEAKMGISSEDESIDEVATAFVKDRRTTESNSRCSLLVNEQKKKDQNIVKEEAKSVLGSLVVDHFISKRYRKEGMMSLDIMGQENECSEEYKSQNEEEGKKEEGEGEEEEKGEGEEEEEEEDDHDNVEESTEMLKGNVRFTDIKTTKNKMANIGGFVLEEKEVSEIHGADRKIKSNREDQENNEKTGAERSGHKIVHIAVVREGNDKKDHRNGIDDKDSRTSRKSERISEEEENGSEIVIMDRGVQGNEERCNTKAEKETIVLYKEKDKTESKTEEENDKISEGETEDKTDISEGEQSFCEYQDDGDCLDASEEEENTDFWGSKDEETESEMEELQDHVRLGRSCEEDDSKQINIDTSTRKEESSHPQEPDMTALSSQNLAGNEHTDTERQRTLWLCCLKTCSLPPFCKSRESQVLEKRCSEDGSMDLLQMNPVESSSSLPAQKVLTSPTVRNADAASILETNAEDSSEELFHSEKESENPNQPWSDSEDNVHSFYD
ncbi:uncharacterized protein LOC142104172 isoform X2 [Mixophyes fleayi]|uniref:uncharacterized protein LOC142104172 isoform X2 n=1 Tax=Mixophyes fleayi TaxID=3061075 RepID=UPI003F4DA47E